MATRQKNGEYVHQLLVSGSPVRLPLRDVKGGMLTNPHHTQIIEDIRHSVSFLKTLPPEVQLKARLVYYSGLRYSFAAAAGVALVGVGASLFASGKALRSTSK